MSAVQDILVPFVGLCTATFLFLGPGKLVLKIAETRRLNSANPLPWPMICGNCFAWMSYSLVIQDLWVYWSNLPGFLMGLYYMLTAFSCTDISAHQLRLLKVIASCCFTANFLGLMIAYLIFPSDSGVQEITLGTNCILQLVVFYISPLSTLRTVIKTRDSSTLDGRLALVMLLNGATWAAYGIFTDDMFLFSPNALGAVNGVVQMACCVIFPRRAEELAVAAKETGGLGLGDFPSEQTIPLENGTSDSPVMSAASSVALSPLGFGKTSHGSSTALLRLRQTSQQPHRNGELAADDRDSAVGDIAGAAGRGAAVGDANL